MKRILLIVATLMVASVALADNTVTPNGVKIRPGNVVDTFVVEGTTDQVTCVDSNLAYASDYWNGATLTVIDQTSNLTDSTRVITDWDATTFTLTFSAFATDSIEDNDSISLVWPDGHYRIRYPDAWVMDSTVDTSEVYRITPGASISSQHMITAAEDSVDSHIFLEIAVSPEDGLGGTGWTRVVDTLASYSTVDTVAYKAWGVIQANYIRFVWDPIDAPFINTVGRGTHYGIVMSDK